MYLLLDLERTLITGQTYFWGANKRGYTANPLEAGRYPIDEAAIIVNGDVNRETIMIPLETIEKYLGDA